MVLKIFSVKNNSESLYDKDYTKETAREPHDNCARTTGSNKSGTAIAYNYALKKKKRLVNVFETAQ